MENGYSYLVNFLISVDQLFNALTGGSCDETLSSRTHRRAHTSTAWSVLEELINVLFIWDVDHQGRRHCELAYTVEMIGGHMPKAMVLRQLKLDEGEA